MARESKKDPSEMSVEQKLKALYQLQTMLSEIDKIKTLRGELPLEVQDLEDEVAGLSTRIEKIQNDIADLKANVATKRIEIETAKASIEKYKAQWLQINFEQLKAHSELWKTAYTESTFWFDLHNYIFGAVLVVAALLIINLLCYPMIRLDANGGGSMKNFFLKSTNIIFAK